MTALDAMKQAIAELALVSSNHSDDPRGQADKAISLLKDALKREEEQTVEPVEPVAWNKKIRASVDSLLEQAGYAADSSVRNQLSMMNFDPAPPPSAERKAALESLLEQFDQPHTEYFGSAIQEAIKELLK